MTLFEYWWNYNPHMMLIPPLVILLAMTWNMGR